MIGWSSSCPTFLTILSFSPSRKPITSLNACDARRKWPVSDGFAGRWPVLVRFRLQRIRPSSTKGQDSVAERRELTINCRRRAASIVMGAGRSDRRRGWGRAGTGHPSPIRLRFRRGRKSRFATDGGGGLVSPNRTCRGLAERVGWYPLKPGVVP